MTSLVEPCTLTTNPISRTTCRSGNKVIERTNGTNRIIGVDMRNNGLTDALSKWYEIPKSRSKVYDISPLNELLQQIPTYIERVLAKTDAW